jgi:carbonic anhydrase
MKRAIAWFACVLLFLSCLAFAQNAPAHGKSNAEADKIWADLMAGNQRFVTGKAQNLDVPALRAKLANGQQPKVMVLTCSDSRVPPEQIFDQNLGDLFVVRSAGNIADAIGLGSIEYSFANLGSTVLVVMGHTQCGAVKAACSGEKMPSRNLQAIVDKIEPAVKMAKKGGDTGEKQLLDAAIRENALLEAKEVLAHSEILRHGVEEGKLIIIPAVYRIETGDVVRLDATK